MKVFDEKADVITLKNKQKTDTNPNIGFKEMKSEERVTVPQNNYSSAIFTLTFKILIGSSFFHITVEFLSKTNSLTFLSEKTPSTS